MTIKDELLAAMLSGMTHAPPPPATDDAGPALPAAAVEVWNKVVRKFSPLIGANSTLLVLERSVEACRPAYPWLPETAAPLLPQTALARLETSLAGRPGDEIIDVQRAILSAFIDQMILLIGMRLTVQFLRAAFPGADAHNKTQENPG